MTSTAVIAIDNSPERLACAAHNAAVYGVADRIQFIEADFVGWVKDPANIAAIGEPIDVVFASPPWGGPDYSAQGTTFDLNRLTPLPGSELLPLLRSLTPHVGIFLPRSTDLDQLAALAGAGSKVEVEEEWMGPKLKAFTAYFGDLVRPVE